MRAARCPKVSAKTWNIGQPIGLCSELIPERATATSVLSVKTHKEYDRCSSLVQEESQFAPGCTDKLKAMLNAMSPEG
eukprot:6201138-Pleurochrysis_carterae.AAC.2